MSISIKRAERRVSLCLDGELFAKYEAAEEALREARLKSATDGRMNGGVAAAEKKVFELFEAQKAASVTFLLRALPRAEWDALGEAHPAREDNELDTEYGFNTSTIFDAALSLEKPVTIVRVTDHEGVDQQFRPSEWAALSADMSKAQHGPFQVAVNLLNGGVNEIPFSHTAYKSSQGSAAKSK